MNMLTQLAAALDDASISVIDLTAPLSSATPVLQLPPDMAPIPPFRLEELAKYDERGATSYQNAIHTGEHVGTHFDAPLHWITGRERADVSEVPVSDLVGRVVVIDKSTEVAEDPDFLLEVEHILGWQEEHGELPEKSWLIYRTGWGARSKDAASFLNVGEDGPHTPGVSAECARWLAEESPIVGIGVETVGTDAGQAFLFDPAFPCHSYMLGAGKYGLTQLQNVALLPPTGAIIIATPLPIVGGSGSPARVIALVSRESV